MKHFMKIFVIFIGITSSNAQISQRIESICGTDNRVLSTDQRIGRLMPVVCTVWLGPNGVLLTAGHCVDLDPDGNGALLPDGVLDLTTSDIVEFNVPLSITTGVPQSANINDQYLIDLGSVEWHWESNGQGIGKDWAIFKCFPNSATGLTPHEAQDDHFRLTEEIPNGSDEIIITGYGIDGGIRNQVQQTDLGDFNGRTQNCNQISFQYEVDTRSGNSGSPVIWNQNNSYTIGIHTNGGCSSSGGSNNGTSFERFDLNDALKNYFGSNILFIDHLTIAGVVGDGVVFSPYDNFTDAYNIAVAGDKLYLESGVYSNAGLIIQKSLTILPPKYGTVQIGY
jgi:V8-like Glu-specific endopeptidase